MITAAQQSDWLLHHLSQSAGNLPGRGLAWLENLRREAARSVAQLPVLNRKQESWRYTSIDSLLQQRFITAGADIGGLENLDISRWMLPGLDAYRLVLVNGRCLPSPASSADLPAGVVLGSLRTALATDPDRLSAWFVRNSGRSDNLFTALNSALINDGALLHVGTDVVLDKPIEILHLHLGHERPLLVQPRNLLVLEPGSGVTLVERAIGADSSAAFHNHLTEIYLSAGASLDHYRLQDENQRSHHLCTLFLSQQEQSRYRGTHLSFGGVWARTDCHALLQQPGGECEINGLYTVGDEQLKDIHLRVHHAAPRCTSRERFKGILHGEGRAVFDGHIIVDRGAQGSDAQLRNDNLMLTRSAEVDTKPQLEIYADDVKCSHGTTVGEVDPAQLFYLRSRGIDKAQALSMLSLGFAAEISNGIRLNALRSYLAQRLARKLGGQTDASGMDSGNV